MTRQGWEYNMRDEQLISVGIDIGTSTTQCVFSRLTLSNTASSFSVPRITITEKVVLYRAPVRITPLTSPDTIDSAALEAMIREDYRDAGISPKDIRLGAVIITGETARKSNARAVTEALSELAGDFVVATAGPALEGILAGRGSGAAALSEARGRSVLNLDIGGGTTNMALFSGGVPVCEGCLDIGGRLLRFRPGTDEVLSFSRAMDLIGQDCGVSLREGMALPEDAQSRLAERMAQVLEEAAGLRERTALHEKLTVEHSLPAGIEPDLFTFSGGVADCVYGTASDSVLFSDLGEALGRAVARSCFFAEHRVLRPAETSHATVIGAGAYSVAVSGSTIQYTGMKLPMKSLPVAAVPFTAPSDISGLRQAIESQYGVYDGECAVYLEGIRSPDFQTIRSAAAQIAAAMAPHEPKVLILREDMAKALGQALAREWPAGTAFLCLDGITLSYGDTVDIGAPLGDGRVVPVIVKTFAFSQG
ncbi:MAG: ethanolamine ammonia-lyase reactivating factor EutA [Clostridia bacterium]|nr:ethanolamine ammonia-lyase reactivating factor EutA [Clostridia bacterium]